MSHVWFIAVTEIWALHLETCLWRLFIAQHLLAIGQRRQWQQMLQICSEAEDYFSENLQFCLICIKLFPTISLSISSGEFESNNVIFLTNCCFKTASELMIETCCVCVKRPVGLMVCAYLCFNVCWVNPISISSSNQRHNLMDAW